MKKNDGPDSPASGAAAQSRRKPSRSALRRVLVLAIFPFLLLIFAHVITLYRHKGMIFNNDLMGPDAYMRLVRVSEWVAGGGWYDQLSLRSNAPFGEILHWSRPLDILLVIGSAIGAIFTDFDTALFWWGSFLNPAIHVVALLLLIWAAEPLLPPPGRVYLGLLSMVQFALVALFSIGRPDHHGLIAAILIALVGVTLRLLHDRKDRRLSICAGLLIALSLWVSIEGMFSAALVFAALGIAWICLGGNFAAKLRDISIATFLGLALAMAVEYPPDTWMQQTYDALSVVHLLIFGLLALFWLLVAVAPPLGDWRIRGGLAVAGGVVALLITWLIYPKFFAGPMVDVHPRVVSEWFRNNQEVMPLFGKTEFIISIQNFLGHLGAAVPAILYGIFLIRRSQGLERRRWLFLVGGLVISVAMTFYERRWAGDAQLFLLIPYTALLLTIMDTFASSAVVRRALLRTIAVVVFAVGPIYLAGISKKVSAKPKIPHSSCNIKAIGKLLNKRYGARQLTIMTYIYLGPEFLFRTPHKVIPSPYHRNTDGMLDFYDFFRAVDVNSARRIAVKRKVDLVVICPKYVESWSFRVAKGKRNLYQDLLRDRPPNWLISKPVPNELADNLKIFETKF